MRVVFHLFVRNGNVTIYDGEDEVPRQQTASRTSATLVNGEGVLDRRLLRTTGLQGTGTTAVSPDREVSDGSRNHQGRAWMGFAA